jgi:hypothetical protein
MRRSRNAERLQRQADFRRLEVQFRRRQGASATDDCPARTPSPAGREKYWSAVDAAGSDLPLS